MRSFLCSIILCSVSCYLLIAQNASSFTYWEKCGRVPHIGNKYIIPIQGVKVNAQGEMLGYREERVSNMVLFRSHDMGKTWTDISENLPIVDPIHTSTHFNPKYTIHSLCTTDKMFLMFQGTGDKMHFLRSKDAGETWEKLPFPDFGLPQGMSSGAESCSKNDRNTLRAGSYFSNSTFSGGSSHTAISSDFGDSWEQLPVKEINYLDDSEKFWRATDEDVWVKKAQWLTDHPDANTKPYQIYEALIRGAIGPPENCFSVVKHSTRIFYHPDSQDPTGELLHSTDDGKTWKVIKTAQSKNIVPLRVDCQGRLYALLPNKAGLYRSSDKGQTWVELVGIAEEDKAINYYPNSFTIGADGRAYTIANKSIYRSTEMVCCNDNSESEAESECPFNKSDKPSFEPATIPISGTEKGRISTEIYVNKEDYVFFGASGEIQLTFRDSHYPASAAGSNFDAGIQKKFPKFNWGALIIHQGEQKYSCDTFNLKKHRCENIFLAKQVIAHEFSGEFGNYFIARQNGKIELEINDLFPEENTGNFSVEIYILTKNQHQFRNCFNECPHKKPEFSALDWRDNKDFQWDERGFLGSSDDEIENCYHPGGEDYRGESDEIKGCQCVYSRKEGNLINSIDNLSLGTYDYGYQEDIGNVKLHFILDVFPHVIYLQSDEGGSPEFRYAPTPKTNIY